MRIQLVDNNGKPFELYVTTMHNINGELVFQHSCDLHLTEDADTVLLQHINGMMVLESRLVIDDAFFNSMAHASRDMYMHQVCKLLKSWMVEFPDGIWKVI